MTIVAIFLYLSFGLLASSSPLQLLSPQLLSTTSLDSTLSSLNLTNHLAPNATTVIGKTDCFIQPHRPGAPTLFETDYNDCLVAVTVLLAEKSVSTPYIFSRRPDAEVRLPYAKSFRTCKIIIDILDDAETDRLRWRDIGDRLEAPRGVLKKCLGQGSLPPLGGRTPVGPKGIMQAIVVGQAWRPVAMN